MAVRVRVIRNSSSSYKQKERIENEWAWLSEERGMNLAHLTASQMRAYKIYCDARDLLRATVENPYLLEDTEDLPRELDTGEVSTEIQSLAYRILRNNQELPEEEGVEDLQPGEATDATVDTEEGEGSDEVMGILADPLQDEEEEITEGKGLPRTLDLPKKDFRNIHEDAGRNLQILSNILGKM